LERALPLIETSVTTEELLAAWQEAQRRVEQLRLDSPGRFAAEDRLHDARIAYHDRIAELELISPDDESVASAN
jgi:hypothetical protein